MSERPLAILLNLPRSTGHPGHWPENFQNQQRDHHYFCLFTFVYTHFWWTMNNFVLINEHFHNIYDLHSLSQRPPILFGHIYLPQDRQWAWLRSVSGENTAQIVMTANEDGNIPLHSTLYTRHQIQGGGRRTVESWISIVKSGIKISNNAPQIQSPAIILVKPFCHKTLKSGADPCLELQSVKFHHNHRSIFPWTSQ